MDEPVIADAQWRIFLGNRTPHRGIARLPSPPPWRPFRTEAVAWERLYPHPADLSPAMRHRGATFQAQTEVIDIVNAGLYLRRPILVTGKPGSGKSSLIDAVAYELQLGEPHRWFVTSRSTLRDALYTYDAVGRLQQKPLAQEDVPLTDFLRLGPLGTALLPTDRPRALLIDEIDKADLDLPNDLLNVLDEGEFEIPELVRLKQQQVDVRIDHGGPHVTYPITNGKVQAKQFPLVIMTSNGERDFPPAFLRRCLRVEMADPCRNVGLMTDIIKAHLGKLFTENNVPEISSRIDAFVKRAASESLAADQLLNALQLVVGHEGVGGDRKDQLIDAITSRLN